MIDVSYHTTKDGARLAYRHIPPQSGMPTIFFLCGFRSDMTGIKVQFLHDLCTQNGWGFLTLDYSGHGLSSGSFDEGTIGQWLDDALSILDFRAPTSVIIIGSSMGGWLAPLVALQRPHTMVGLVGIASAPDFTEDLIWRHFTPEQQADLLKNEFVVIPTHYNPDGWRISKDLIEEGRRHLILGKSIHLDMPIRLIHGMQDTDVPYAFSQGLLENVVSTDVTLTLVKTGDHRLCRDEDLRRLAGLITELVEKNKLC